MELVWGEFHAADMARKPYKKKSKTGSVPRHFLREWRELRGLTQEQLADKAGMTVPQISKIETGKRAYRQSTLEQFAVALGCEPADLLRQPTIHRSELGAYLNTLTPQKRSQALKVIKALESDEETVT